MHWMHFSKTQLIQKLFLVASFKESLEQSSQTQLIEKPTKKQRKAIISMHWITEYIGKCNVYLPNGKYVSVLFMELTEKNLSWPINTRSRRLCTLEPHHL